MRFVLYISSLLLVVNSIAQTDPIVSSFNNEKIVKSNTEEYSFIVSGHFYGNRNNLTGNPVNTVLANIDWINSSKHVMLMSLGDIFMDVKNDSPIYKKTLFSKLKKPLFNAVGNHDLSGDYYQKNYGKTYYFFNVNNDIHLILDTEINDGGIKEEQLDLINEILKLVNTNKINNVFIYAHRTLFARSYSELDLFFTDNTQSILGNNFESDVLPLLKKINNKSKVTWFSGSLGDAPASFLQFKDNNNIQYVATAVRGLKRDAFLIVTVKNGNVEFSTKSLTNQNLENFLNYNVDYWNKNIGKKKPFNYRLLPLYIKETILSLNFLFGVLSALIILIIFRMFIKLK